MTQSLLSFKDAKTRLMTIPAKSIGTESIPLAAALNRIVAKDIFAPTDVPAFANSAMDGFAVRIKEVARYKSLTLAGTIFAGQTPPNHWPAGSCFKIMTGAMLPVEADAVVMYEETEEKNGQVYFPNPVNVSQNIRFPGEDVRKGSKIISKGQTLTIPLLTQLSTLGVPSVEAVNPVRVALFSTGNELISAGTPLQSGKIYDSNRLMLTLLLQQLGCQIIDLGIAKDNKEAIKTLLWQAADNADLILTSGGVSIGDADYTYSALTETGKIYLWKIAMKPGKPFACGHIGSALFCGLPGNPVSAFTVFYQLVQPLILRLSGQNEEHRRQLPTFKVRTLHKLHKRPGRLDFQRGRLVTTPTGELCVESTGSQDSHLLHSLSTANCFIILAPEQTTVKAGEWVIVEPFNNQPG